MIRYWTTYWRGAAWLSNKEFSPVVSSGGTFRKRGIKKGDIAYVVSVQQGVLFLGGKMEIGQIVPRREAVKIRRTNSLYDAPEWLIAAPGGGSPLNLRRTLDPKLVAGLRFLSGKSELPLKFKRDTRLDEQTLRGVRELTEASAHLLDEIIRVTDGLPRGQGPILVSTDLLGRLSTLPHAFLPEEPHSFEEFREGSAHSVVASRYERDPNARAACLAHFGPVCAACDQDLAALYGEVALGLIHVHHLISLASIRRAYAVDPINDLRPVCPNCHAVIHRRDPPYSIAEIREFLRAARSKSSSSTDSKASR
jgi:hypothetical protein